MIPAMKQRTEIIPSVGAIQSCTDSDFSFVGKRTPLGVHMKVESQGTGRLYAVRPRGCSMLAQWSSGSLEARDGQDSAVRKRRALYS